MDLPLSSGNVAPAWLRPRREFPELKEDVEADIAIIGGGIVGLTAALELAERGRKVVLVEAGRFGEGSTGWCAGILSASTTVDLSQVGEEFGSDRARMILQAVEAGLEKYRTLVGARADWQTGKSFYLAARKRHVGRFADELYAHSRYGIPASAIDEQQLRSNWRGFHGGLCVQNEHAVHPVALLNAIAEAAYNAGAWLFEQSPVLDRKAADGSVIIRTAGGSVRAQHLLVATGVSGLDDRERKRINRFVIPVSGRIVVTQPSPDVARLAASGTIAAWDSLLMYHYVRYLADGRMIIGGGEASGRVKAGSIALSDKHVQELLTWAQNSHTFPIPAAEAAWQAGLIFPADGLPFVQKKEVQGSRVVSVVTDGLPFATALAPALADVLTTGEHWLTDCLSIDRRLPIIARLAGLVPPVEPLRSLIHKATFKVVELYDRM